MSENGVAVVAALVMCVVVIALFWRQLVVIIGLGIVVVFCLGLYVIVASIYP